MAELNAEIFKQNYPEIYQEIYNLGYAAGEVKYRALAEAYRDSLPKTEPGPSGVSADQSAENRKILESMVPRL